MDDDGIRRTQRIIELGERLDKLVADLLYFSRLGRAELHYQAISLATLVDNIRPLLETTLHERNARIELVNENTVIHCDPTQMQSAFLNLITNGIKYNDNNEILIEVGCDEPATTETSSQTKTITLWVRDNGIGIDEVFHQEIFRIFKRLNHDDAYGYGTGGGLTFVKKTVEKHHGKVWVESALGQGSTFYITLPLIYKENA